MVFLGKRGWPVELIKGRPITNGIRLLIHTRKIVRVWHQPSWITEPSQNCRQDPTNPEETDGAT